MNVTPPSHPVYVVKVDNTSSAQPQLGLDKADLVVEELVEGGLTRLAVFYYSQLPHTVGPVRSIRATDIAVSAPVNAFIVASGAAPKTTRLLNSKGVNRIVEGARGFFRSTIRPSPDNLMMKLPVLTSRRVERQWKQPHHKYLPFGKDNPFTGGHQDPAIKPQHVSGVTVHFSGSSTDTWVRRGKRWTRTNSFAAPGHDFHANNLLFLRVREVSAGYLDPAGNPVPRTVVSGSGAATLVHGDQAVTGTWHKHGDAGTFTLTAGGKTLHVPAGHTFVSLVPVAGGSVTLQH